MKDSQTKGITTNMFWNNIFFTGWLSSSSTFGGGDAFIMQRCLREGVIDRWIQANYYNQDIFRWLAFTVYYVLEQNGVMVRYTRFITLLFTSRVKSAKS